MEPIYLDLSLSLTRVKERANLTDTLQDAHATELLKLSAGSSEEHPKVYRPYYVAAYILEQDVARQQLTKAGDVEFTQFISVITSLRSLQLSIDTQYSKLYGMSLPPGFEVVVIGVAPRNSSPSGSVSLRNTIIF